MKYLVIAALSVIMALAVHSKLNPKMRANLDKSTASYVDQATSAVADATQKGLTEANKELGEARRNADKK